ncbi:folate-binding protein YgfZ [Rhodanobacter sp. TND4EL1]
MTISLPAETLLIEGPDASAFAHAQFSSAASSLAVRQWQFSAWLDPKGRVLALFHLARLAEDRYLLLLRGGSAASIVEALRRFVFRSKVRINALPPRGLATGPALPFGAVTTEVPDARDDDTLLLGCESHSLLVTRGSVDDAWRTPELCNGWPWLADACLGEFLPPALSLQRLQAVVVDKGCYPGQEIVARMHFRNGHKRHLHRVTLSQPAQAGDALRTHDEEAGCVLDVLITNASVEALVILRDDVATAAKEGSMVLFNDNIALSIISSWPA